MPYRLSRLGYVEVRVLDLDDALQHYVDVLGLLVTSREGRRAQGVRGRRVPGAGTVERWATDDPAREPNVTSPPASAASRLAGSVDIASGARHSGSRHGGGNGQQQVLRPA